MANGIGEHPRDLLRAQQRIRFRVNQLAWRGSSASAPAKRPRSNARKCPVRRASNAKLGGSCTSRQARRAPSPPACARNSSSSASQSASRRSWVIVLGSFAQKRKSCGTAAAHFSYWDRRCGRWNDELISVAGKRVA
jgi:hypothetical protein